MIFGHFEEANIISWTWICSNRIGGRLLAQCAALASKPPRPNSAYTPQPVPLSLSHNHSRCLSRTPPQNSRSLPPFQMSHSSAIIFQYTFPQPQTPSPTTNASWNTSRVFPSYHHTRPLLLHQGLYHSESLTAMKSRNTGLTTEFLSVHTETI